MISLCNLSYAYRNRKDFYAINDMTADITPGIHLLLGENGAGKTTLLHLIAGLLIPADPEQCLVDGMAPGRRDPALMQHIFFVSDDMKFPFPTINEMVRLHAPFFPAFDHEMLRRNLETFGMNGDEPIDSFSLGNRKKAILAYALALRPTVLLLDEPANGLDITAKQLILSLMSECIDESQTVILSTHTVADFMQLFDSVILLSAGRLILNMPVWEIVERLDFVTETMPPADAIYIEQYFGRFRAIVPRRPGSPLTDIDYLLLYNGLQNVSSRHSIIKLLSETDS